MGANEEVYAIDENVPEAKDHLIPELEKAIHAFTDKVVDTHKSVKAVFVITAQQGDFENGNCLTEMIARVHPDVTPEVAVKILEGAVEKLREVGEKRRQQESYDFLALG